MYQSPRTSRSGAFFRVPSILALSQSSGVGLLHSRGPLHKKSGVLAPLRSRWVGAGRASKRILVSLLLGYVMQEVLQYLKNGQCLDSEIAVGMRIHLNRCGSIFQPSPSVPAFPFGSVRPGTEDLPDNDNSERRSTIPNYRFPTNALSLAPSAAKPSTTAPPAATVAFTVRFPTVWLRATASAPSVSALIAIKV